MAGSGPPRYSRRFLALRRFRFIKNYSEPFFDGQHYVLKGASPRTAARLARPSFRNWFRPSYPYVYATFRLGASVDVRTALDSGFARDVRAGLTRSGQKTLPCRYFYDELGVVAIRSHHALPEYGLTRADERILQAHASGDPQSSSAQSD